MRSDVIVIASIGTQNPAQMRLAQDDEMIHTLATDRPDQPFSEAILPRRGLCRSVEIFEVRPNWRDRSKLQEHSIAKATYNKSKQNWKIFWQRADLNWHSYFPNP